MLRIVISTLLCLSLHAQNKPVWGDDLAPLLGQKEAAESVEAVEANGNTEKLQLRIAVSKPQAAQCVVTIGSDYDGAVTGVVEVSQYDISGKLLKTMPYRVSLRKGQEVVRNVGITSKTTRCSAVAKSVEASARTKSKKELQTILDQKIQARDKINAEIKELQSQMGIADAAEAEVVEQ